MDTAAMSDRHKGYYTRKRDGSSGEAGA